MQMSKIILPLKEDIDLDAFPYLAQVTHLHFNNKTRKYKHFIYPYGVPILSFLFNFYINRFCITLHEIK